jgi:glucokinase
MRRRTSANHTYAIGLDVGGTKVLGGIVGFPTGAILERRAIPTRHRDGGEAVLADVLELTEWLTARARELQLRVELIGVGVAELVDPAGTITSEHTIRWRGVRVRESLERFGRVTIESDVRAAALAEATIGAGRDARLLVYVTIGTGISSCFVQDGRAHAGARGNALVLSSCAHTSDCTACGARTTTVLEEFAAGPALARRYSERTGIAVKGAEEVLEAARKGDGAACEVVESAADALGVAVGWLVDVLDPEMVIVGGGLGTAGGLYWDRLVASTRRHIWAEASRELPVRMAALGPNAGLIGAAQAAVNSTKAEEKHGFSVGGGPGARGGARRRRVPD